MDGAVQHAAVGEDVKQRQHADDAITILAVRVYGRDLPRIGRQILMGKHRTLGQAGGAAGILDKRDVLFGIDGGRRAVVFISEQVRKPARSEEHTSELQSLMRISYAVFSLKKKTKEQS